MKKGFVVELYTYVNDTLLFHLFDRYYERREIYFEVTALCPACCRQIWTCIKISKNASAMPPEQRKSLQKYTKVPSHFAPQVIKNLG